ncbi:hypothetical protein BJ875DRAFT_271782 [Amylocarpus encephaloides]|uniref:Uncharacterized protein n=1 Tax=Amylocarpus encephaloides TaxID=45428 RepID=A0A9P7YKT5_9HELO|nr:hypothetical protein BJ875DRAFT_271782 [Amylocarpus encephaloides]
MAKLLQDAYLDVLEELDKHLRPKEPLSWAPAFRCILVLCMCAEMVETTTDLRVVNAMHDMSRSPDGLDQNRNKASREDSIAVCRKLDEAIRSAESSYHLIYKTTRLKGESRKSQAFNPIRYGSGVVKKANLGKDVEDFADSMIAVVTKHREYSIPPSGILHVLNLCQGNELKPETTLLSFDPKRDVAGDHQAFEKHNSGRLVSRFIQSLL